MNVPKFIVQGIPYNGLRMAYCGSSKFELPSLHFPHNTGNSNDVEMEKRSLLFLARCLTVRAGDVAAFSNNRASGNLILKMQSIISSIGYAFAILALFSGC